MTPRGRMVVVAGGDGLLTLVDAGCAEPSPIGLHVPIDDSLRPCVPEREVASRKRRSPPRDAEPRA